MKVCAWCKKAAMNDHQWVEIEELLDLYGIFTRNVMPGITHGICPDCYASMIKKLGIKE